MARELWRRPTDRTLARAALLSLAVFLVCALFSLQTQHPGAALVINRAVTRFPESVAEDLFLLTVPTLQSVFVVAMLCGCWLADSDRDLRARILTGCGGALAAAFLAHWLQHSFPSGPKPLYVPGFSLPPSLEGLRGPFTDRVESGHSFPSERGTLFAGIAAVVFIARRPMGVVALAGTLIVEGARVLLGLHYLTDVAGSVALAAAFVCVFSLEPVGWLARPLLRWEKVAPASFYAIAFIVAYELSTTFDELRWILGKL